MLTKLIDVSSYYEGKEPQVSLLNVGESKGFLTKQAATDSRIEEYARSIEPSPDKVYVHILAMGAGEYYGANRNADWFPRKNLIEHHKTFYTNPGHVFEHHKNKDPAIALGQIVYSVYNERMQRVELIAWIDKIKGAHIVRKIEAGELPPTSMACKTPSDTCSICGNKARTRQEYCEHLVTQLGKIYPDGRKVMAINDQPLSFFDISLVVRPADVTSSIMQKLAHENDHVIGSAEAAEDQDLRDLDFQKSATVTKLADLIKEVDGEIVGTCDNLDPLLERIHDLPVNLVDTLHHFPLKNTLHSMATMGISPSIEFLGELIARKSMGEEGKGMGTVVAGLVAQSPLNDLNLNQELEGSDLSNAMIQRYLLPHATNSSMLPEYLEKAAMEMPYSRMGVLPPPGQGYIGNHLQYQQYFTESSPARITPEEMYLGIANRSKEESHSLVKKLMEVAGAAILAKWFITSTIEQKMKELEEKQLNNFTNNQMGVKINLVKASSDFKLTYRLAKAAMVKVLKKK